MLRIEASFAVLSITPTVKIDAASLSKRFGRHWIVRNFSHSFSAGSFTAISGPNGSGKSTLLRLLSGQLIPTSGELVHTLNGQQVNIEDVYREVSLTGPYLELIEELSGIEAIRFHESMRGFRQNLQPDDLWERLGWKKRIQRQAVSSYSSGMKQRLKLVLACATRSSLLMLDEPTSNLDAEGVAWYQALIEAWGGERTVLIASNESRDFVGCTSTIEASSWQVSAG